MEKLTCATCRYFQEDAEMPIKGGVVPAGTVAGMCAVDPPTMHMIPLQIPPRSMFEVESGGARQMTLVPAPIERGVLNTRAACSRHAPKVSH